MDIKIKCDTRKMEVVFSNLISNSVSALDGSGEIDILFNLDDDNVVIMVKDSGPGIPEKDLDRVFEPLYTTKKTGTEISYLQKYCSAA